MTRRPSDKLSFSIPIASSSPGVTYKVGLNGVTTYTKTGSAGKDQKIRAITKQSAAAKDKYTMGGHRDSNGDPYASSVIDEVLGNHHGVLTSDEFGDVNSSYTTVTLTRMSKVSEAQQSGKISAGSLLKFLEETGTVVCTRYCNYTAAELSIRNGNSFDQVHCGMVYLEYLELPLPAFAGELLTCVADIYFTAGYTIELKSVIWAEDLTSCNRRVVCKASAWYAAFNVLSDWKLNRIPKLYLDSRLEKEGQARYEKYKEERKRINTSKIQYSSRRVSVDVQTKPSTGTRKHSEMVLTHVAGIYDCGTHMYVHCGAIVAKMEECASMVSTRHSSASEAVAVCGYHFNFLELVPRGSLMIIYAQLTFTSHRLMEVEVMVDIEILHDQSLETKRVAVGYFGVHGLSDESRVVPIPHMKPIGAEEEARFLEGQKRFELMRKHLRHTDIRVAAFEATDSKRAACHRE